jgi:hypothetical protein
MFTKIGIVSAIFIVALMMTAGNAGAQASWPDMKGLWTATSSSVVIGGEKHHPGKVEQGKPRYREVKFTFRITDQKDRRFFGTLQSEHHTETFIGVFANNQKQIMMADSDGFMEATLIDANTIDYCYRHITSGSAVVACSVMKREPK